MAKTLEGKSVVITGGAMGIGRAVAHAAAEQGANITILDVNETDGSATANEVGGRFLKLDVTDPEAWASVAEELGEPDYVHLNAGVMTTPASAPLEPGNILTVDLANYRRIMAINVDGVVYGLRALAPRMQAKGGVITVTASIAGFLAIPFDPAYAMSKHAMIGLVRSMGEVWADTNLTINAICPGMVDTAIVPDGLDSSAAMPPAVMAAEVIDLFLNGANGETRVKLADALPGQAIPAPDLGADLGD